MVLGQFGRMEEPGQEGSVRSAMCAFWNHSPARSPGSSHTRCPGRTGCVVYISDRPGKICCVSSSCFVFKQCNRRQSPLVGLLREQVKQVASLGIPVIEALGALAIRSGAGIAALFPHTSLNCPSSLLQRKMMLASRGAERCLLSNGTEMSTHEKFG
jgi:hypothetical protein